MSRRHRDSHECYPPWHRPGPFPRTRGSWHALRDELRFYYGAHLHRRMFWWFGFAIFITAASVELFGRWQNADWVHRPHPNTWLLLIPAIVLWIASGKVARRIARPLYELAQVAKDIGNGNLAARARLARGGFDEIALLSSSINDMASRIERQVADQRELLAGVSHELRTPLARLRVLMEIVRERGSQGNTLDQMEREIIEIDSLVGELLASARLDFQSIDERVLNAVDVATRALERAGVDVAKLRNEATETTFRADPTLLARALANLIDNAQKHGRGATRLRVYNEPGCLVFEVQDAGPGFAYLAQAEAVPERALGSLGLGLVLVRRIAKAHGGMLELKNGGGGGLAVLTLPFAKPAAPKA